MKRFRLSIQYDGFNGIKHITSYGDTIKECLENMLPEIQDFKYDFKNNNMKTGGNTSFTQDAENLFNDCRYIIDEIKTLL